MARNHVIARVEAVLITQDQRVWDEAVNFARSISYLGAIKPWQPSEKFKDFQCEQLAIMLTHHSLSFGQDREL